VASAEGDLSGKTIVAILTGRNVSPDELVQIFKDEEDKQQ